MKKLLRKYMLSALYAWSEKVRGALRILTRARLTAAHDARKRASIASLISSDVVLLLRTFRMVGRVRTALLAHIRMGVETRHTRAVAKAAVSSRVTAALGNLRQAVLGITRFAYRVRANIGASVRHRAAAMTALAARNILFTFNLVRPRVREMTRWTSRAISVTQTQRPLRHAAQTSWFPHVLGVFHRIVSHRVLNVSHFITSAKGAFAGAVHTVGKVRIYTQNTVRMAGTAVRTLLRGQTTALTRVKMAAVAAVRALPRDNLIYIWRARLATDRTVLVVAVSHVRAWFRARLNADGGRHIRLLGGVRFSARLRMVSTALRVFLLGGARFGSRALMRLGQLRHRAFGFVGALVSGAHFNPGQNPLRARANGIKAVILRGPDCVTAIAHRALGGIFLGSRAWMREGAASVSGLGTVRLTERLWLRLRHDDGSAAFRAELGSGALGTSAGTHGAATTANLFSGLPTMDVVEAADWEYPVLTDHVLLITQIYGLNRDGSEITLT